MHRRTERDRESDVVRVGEQLLHELGIAARELIEEAGLTASDWRVLVDLDTAPGFSDESVRVYLATGLTDVGRPEAHDEEADLTLKWFPLEEAVRMVLPGPPCDFTADMLPL